MKHLYRVSYLLAIVSTLLWSAPAFADQPIAEPSDRQFELNTRAVEAIEQGKYSLAINLLEDSLQEGALNITYLNLGRAYQLMGRCEQARAAFSRVEEVAAIAKPDPQFIASKKDDYLVKLDEACQSGRDSTTTVEKPAKSGAVRIIVQRQPANLKPWAWTATATGGAALLAAGGLHLWARSIRSDLEAADRNGFNQVEGVSQADAFERQDRANTLDTAAVATAITGAVITSVGIYLFTADAASTPDTASDTDLALGASADRVEFTFTTRF
ncbi:tetratricopeptide repeat protein [Persicimonas caeni]|uniref:Tetratricopeptide repeat protein n=1 Tax=Persicimonas caeni TaxID=2292766 RepID=A0A4Y6PYX1_PERCE|nr:tetratricopeptide repeat protein [Persicimonas caeni]QDG53518.1 tetratricopeptide repeat protein [Persicimonas caeni]QED34739.1 tetratricopeptide repeat protein [Persicimonas caeni]